MSSLACASCLCSARRPDQASCACVHDLRRRDCRKTQSRWFGDLDSALQSPGIDQILQIQYAQELTAMGSNRSRPTFRSKPAIRGQAHPAQLPPSPVPRPPSKLFHPVELQGLEKLPGRSVLQHVRSDRHQAGVHLLGKVLAADRLERPFDAHIAHRPRLLEND